MIRIKYLLFAACAFLAGCGPFVTTSPTTGHRKVMGVKIPFTGNPERVIEDDKLRILVEQLEKFGWVGIILIIAGAIWWKVTDGFTGLGKLLFGLGWIFVGLALLLPHIIAYLVLITILLLVGAVSYVIWIKVLKRKR